MIANYHTHTFRCGHAEGNERDYVEQAVKSGLKILGFSDHTPYDYFDYGPRNRPIRMMPEELPGYADSIRALAREYRDQLKICLGVEAEYYPKYFPRLMELIHASGIQYMILGQHYLGNEIGEAYCATLTTDAAALDRYVGQSIDGLDTGVFTYFAHPDLINYVGDDALYDRQMRRLCRAALQSGTPLEINLLGIRDNRNYPNERFWRIAGEEGNTVILGCDAHKPCDVYDAASEEKALRLVEKYALNLIHSVALVQP